jgi:hypothetical protein
LASLLFPNRRTESAPVRLTEGTIEQLIATGAAGGFGIDPIDGDTGFTPIGSHLGREIPVWTLDKARAYSVNAYRVNPVARAIIDTYTSFCVGDSGVTVNCNVPEVRAVVDKHWTDPKVNLGALQELWLRSHLLMGETVHEAMVGGYSGVVRFSPIDPGRLINVDLLGGNALWPAVGHIRVSDGTTQPYNIITADDITGLRSGDLFFWPSFKTLLTDKRGFPFLGPVIDQLEDYDQVLSNLVDRTALMRYMGFDVTLKGADRKQIGEFISDRGGVHVPASGTIEVHNESVEWKALNAETGAAEDTTTAQNVLTEIAAGTGLSRTWLAEPEGANRATSLTMAEPVRRRVGGVQNMWLALQTEWLRFVVDQAVIAHQLPATVNTVDVAGNQVPVAASQTVTVIGPEIAASDAQINAELLTSLSKALVEMVAAGVLTDAAAKVAAKKGWEMFVGTPYNPELDKPDGSAKDDLAEVLDDPSTMKQIDLRISA